MTDFELDQFGRPIVYLARYEEDFIPESLVKGMSSGSVFTNRAEAVRWAKFSIKQYIDWTTWVPDGDDIYPNEQNRDNVNLAPSFIATYEASSGFPRAVVTVSKTSVVQVFDWWAKEADGPWNK